MKNIKKYVLTLIVAMISLGNSAQEPTPEETVEPPVITIFIHGTKPQIPDWFYKKGNYFFKPGLHHVDCLCNECRPEAIIDGLKDSGDTDLKHLYFFGWSGKLSAKKRLKAAQELLQELEVLVQMYREKYHCTPKIRTIAHSHGGNLMLNLARLLEVKESDIVIDELINLASPVQSWTKEYIKSKNCKKVYNIFSAEDLIQAVDPQGVQVHFNKDQVKDKPHFFELSHRTFDHHDNLTQVQVKINEKNPSHMDFIDLASKKLQKLFPNAPRFLPEIGRIISLVNDTKVQEHIAENKTPVLVKIDTDKKPDEGRVTVYL